MRKIVTLLVLICFAVSASAQKKLPALYKKEFRVITDNDAYLLKKKDGYYTNGIFLQYNWASKRGVKEVNSIEIGQRMYTSRNRFMLSLAEYDRPFAGYLYGKFQRSFFDEKDNAFRYSISAGTIGRNSLAEALQTNYHRLISIYKTYGWDVQVKNELALNASFTWSPVLFQPKTKTGLFAVKPVLTANLGNTFTNAEIGTLLQFGLFENNSNSALWNASVQSQNRVTKRNFEAFAFFHPQLITTAYNATVQGPLFREDKGVFTSDIHRLQYRHRLGFVVVRGRITAGGDFIFETKEAKTQKAFQRYGTLHMGYRFN
jgi:lipid A 3-O-deacylase